MVELARKTLGAYYTPDRTVSTLVRWAVRSTEDHLLDPSCGDGRFLAKQAFAFGVECDPLAAAAAARNVPHARVFVGDFFEWAERTTARFDCAVGNPPFIRYQRFSGRVRKRALGYCAKQGAAFSSLTSSWPPFLVAAATLLRPGGRMAFVVPAEIGHAPYSAPLLEFLARNFRKVQVIAIQEKLFPDLSEDAWLLYAEGYGESTKRLLFSMQERFRPDRRPPAVARAIPITEWRQWNSRLRPFVLDEEARLLYAAQKTDASIVPLAAMARVGIGYVTGANDFFHLRPSLAKSTGIPDTFLLPSVRNGRALAGLAVTPIIVNDWLRSDEPVLLLRLPADDQEVPVSVRRYLDSPAGEAARLAYKCRMRKPWYVVPDVHVPDAFLSYMCGESPLLVANEAGCVCTNSVHAVRLKPGVSLQALIAGWSSSLARLSCELEGHPLGGGMLKLEPREAGRVLVPGLRHQLEKKEAEILDRAWRTMRRWRHYE